jgi:hypothetical protein
MRTETIDTDQIYDRCHCGARAKQVCNTVDNIKIFKVCCSECAESVDWTLSLISAMTAWNIAMRNIKKNTKFVDDWDLAIEVRGLIQEASIVLLWLGDKNGDPHSRITNINYGLRGMTDRWQRINKHISQRKEKEKNESRV